MENKHQQALTLALNPRSISQGQERGKQEPAALGSALTLALNPRSILGPFPIYNTELVTLFSSKETVLHLPTSLFFFFFGLFVWLFRSVFQSSEIPQMAVELCGGRPSSGNPKTPAFLTPAALSGMLRVDVGSSIGNYHPGTVFLELVRKVRAAWRKDLNFQQLQERKVGREGGREGATEVLSPGTGLWFLRMGIERWQR